MSQIKVEHVTFSYASTFDAIFEDVSFQIDTDWKLGFIGRNGRGKTTFLRLLQGAYEYEGSIHTSVQFDYFPYPVENPERMTGEILEAICPTAEEWEFMREFSYLELGADTLWRPFSTLSNGERTKALLAALFLNEGHFLLIDEPTNHLDTHAREMVSAYLQQKKGFILVSHDRSFLDGCVDHILSLNRANIEVQAGNFSSWMENFERQQNYEMTQNERLRKDIRRLKQATRQTAHWSDKVEATKVGAGDKGYVGHMAAKMMKRSMAIRTRQERAIEEKQDLLKNVEKAEDLKIGVLPFHGGRMVEAKDISIAYDRRTVCSDVSFEIREGERLAVYGRNGCGKSSLLKLILEKAGCSVAPPIDHSGVLKTASGLVISYVPQDTSFLRGPLQAYARECGIDETQFLTILRKMDFERVQFEKPMESYSDGQRKKVLIARSLCEKAHLYIWDEPLNFIDVYSRMQIETLLSTAEPTMLFVEHDRAFCENIATDFLEM